MKLFLIALAAGALSAFAFQPVGLRILMPLALAGLCELLWRSKSLKQALGLGWAFGLGQFVVGLNWIATAYTYQAKMPAWLGWVAVVLLSLYLAIYPALAAGLAFRFKGDRRVALVLVLSGAWTVTEWLRGTMFTGFPWNPLAAADSDTLMSIVPMIGTYGATAFVVFLGGALWMLKDWEIRPLIFWTLSGVSLQLATDFTTDPRDTRAMNQIRIVQPNIGQEVKWRPEFADETARRLAMLSMKPGGRRPRLLFWPEAAITNPLEDARLLEQPYAQFERQRAAAKIGPNE
jgi:apolipoprotein N-acyltransferase